MMLGSWKLVDAGAAALPQKVETAYEKVMQGFVGADYSPIAYVGEQLVSGGTNYAIIAKRTLVTLEPKENIVLMEIFLSTDMSLAHIVGVQDIL